MGTYFVLRKAYMFIHIDLCRTTHLPADLHLLVTAMTLMIISLNYTLTGDLKLPLICDAMQVVTS